MRAVSKPMPELAPVITIVFILSPYLTNQFQACQKPMEPEIICETTVPRTKVEPKTVTDQSNIPRSLLHDLWIISDEVYEDFVYERKPYSFCEAQER
jgi:hypothetical protein